MTRQLHYTHVLCVALHGVLHKLDDLDMRHSFEQRLAGRATIHRWEVEIREADDAPGDATTQWHRLNRALRDRIEQHLDDAGIDRDETSQSPLPEIELRIGEGEARESIHFEVVELVDRSLRDGHRQVSRGGGHFIDVDRCRAARVVGGWRWQCVTTAIRWGENTSGCCATLLWLLRGGAVARRVRKTRTKFENRWRLRDLDRHLIFQKARFDCLYGSCFAAPGSNSLNILRCARRTAHMTRPATTGMAMPTARSELKCKPAAFNACER